MEPLDLLIGAAVGVGGTLGTAVIAPRDGRLVRWLRRAIGDRPYTVVVETDPRRMPLQPAILPLSFYFETPGEDEPRFVSHDAWWAWAHERGAVDVGESRLTLFISTSRAGVVLRAVRILDAVTPVAGGVVRSPGEIGGGHAPVLLLSVDLDCEPPAVRLEGGDGTQGPFAPYKLDADDLVVLTLLARTDRNRHEWSIELDLLVDGRPFTHPIFDDDDRPFVTVGSQGLMRESWVTDMGVFDEETGDWEHEPLYYWLPETGV